MSEQSNFDNLTAEEYEKLNRWLDGFSSAFWRDCVVPFIEHQQTILQDYCCAVNDEKEWREARGKLQLINSFLHMEDFVVSEYEAVSEDRASYDDDEELPDDLSV